ncbi:hypothetical protein AGDE_02911 [Angomonas deanei]|uniref:Uncharacterized protein n=1 Tax=Angomonas deanei TaxID=59799 RepID=A0A7G2C9W3_9TRYP|nr:hypothetical protein AGDE_02911 [Angomonas deanei]CAD2216546.1 hypothetical protein, conserved [Angomonas deanei]|eukprot:EPY41014.1 hypothetical protein AGDE_02911 [Angomonas deanei]
MSLQQQVISTVSQFNPFHIAASAIAQQVFAMAWFGCLVNHLDSYWTAADKGVRRFEHVVFHYPPIVGAAASFLSSVLRSLLITLLVTLFKVDTLVDYQVAALLVVVFGLVRIHRHFSCQRPIQLFVTETGFELAASMIATLVLYYMQLYKI